MSTEHLLCYIRRNSLASWKLDSIKRGAANHPIPAYGSNDRNFPRFARSGNVLWVVSGSPDAPPSLEARIEISSVLKKKQEWKVEVRGSSTGSAFYGFNDASSALMQLVFRNNKSLWSLRDKYSSTTWSASYGREFQSLRRLALPGERINRHQSAGAAPLEQLASRAESRSVFISWKHTDNDRKRRQFLRALTVELAKLGFAVWWDQTALTDLGTVGADFMDERDDLMRKLLRQGISNTTAVLALWTEKYGTPSIQKGANWTQDEWQVPHNPVRIAMVPGEFARKPLKAEPDGIVPMAPNSSASEAARVARHFKRVYDSLNRKSRA